MKPRFTFQTLILVVLAPVVAALTALWAWQVYRSAHRVILDGFDRKLLTVAGSAAAFVDGDAHARYQRGRTIVALAPATNGLAGFDATLGELVAIDTTTGGARPLVSAPIGGALRSLATSAERPGFTGLNDDGLSILEIDTTERRVLRTVALAGELDGIAFIRGKLTGWRGTALFGVDVASGALTPLELRLPEPLRALAVDGAGERWCGLTQDGSAILVLDSQAKLVRRVALYTLADAGAFTANPEHLPPPALRAIAFHDRQLFGAGVAFTTIDLETGQVARGNFTKGYFDVDAPFYQQHRRAFVELQKVTGLSYLYTQVYTGGNEIYYVLDGTLTPEYSRPGTTDELPANTIEAAERVQFLGRPWISPIQSWDAWGLLKSCFTPVRDSSGRVVAMAGADVDIGVIRKKTRWAAFAAILIGVASLIAAGVVSFRVARALTRPLQNLKEATLWIAAGYYGAKIEVGGTREISALAATLDRLRVRLDGEGKRVRSWQEEIREARQRTALSQALDETMAHVGGSKLTNGGACHRAADGVWWHAPAEADALANDCARARNTALAFELLASGCPHAEIPALVLAAEPELAAVACWQDETNTLHYNTRGRVTLRTATSDRRLDGAGQIRFAVCPAVQWLPAEAEIQATPGGTLS